MALLVICRCQAPESLEVLRRQCEVFRTEGSCRCGSGAVQLKHEMSWLSCQLWEGPGTDLMLGTAKVPENHLR